MGCFFSGCQGELKATHLKMASLSVTVETRQGRWDTSLCQGYKSFRGVKDSLVKIQRILWPLCAILLLNLTSKYKSKHG